MKIHVTNLHRFQLWLGPLRWRASVGDWLGTYDCASSVVQRRKRCRQSTPSQCLPSRRSRRSEQHLTGSSLTSQRWWNSASVRHVNDQYLQNRFIIISMIYLFISSEPVEIHTYYLTAVTFILLKMLGSRWNRVAVKLRYALWYIVSMRNWSISRDCERTFYFPDGGEVVKII